jgi:hypothetical protein
MSVLSQGVRALLDLKLPLKPNGNQQWDSHEQNRDALTTNFSTLTAPSHFEITTQAHSLFRDVQHTEKVSSESGRFPRPRIFFTGNWTVRAA